MYDVCVYNVYDVCVYRVQDVCVRWCIRCMRCRRYLVLAVGSQQVGGQRVQLVRGHVLERGQAAPAHGLLQVDGRVAEGVHRGWGQLVTRVQDLHRRDAHHTAVQSA